MNNLYDKDLQNLLVFLGLEHLGDEFRLFLNKNGISNQEIQEVGKYGPYIFWYFGLDEFIKGKSKYPDWEFNYFAMSCLRLAILEINKKDFLLSQKMTNFINNQTIVNAEDIQKEIEKSVNTDIIKSLYKKIININIRNSEKELYIIAGANGTGKSTLAQKIITNKQANGENIVFINADEIARELDPQNIEKVKIQAGKETLKRAIDTLELKQSFILESTLSGKIKESKYSLLTIIKKAKAYDYKIKLLYIYLDNPILCQERIKVRVFKGGHYVPSTDVIRRFSRSIKNFFKYKDMIADWILYSNNTKDFTEIAKSINGAIEILDENSYNKIKEVINND